MLVALKGGLKSSFHRYARDASGVRTHKLEFQPGIPLDLEDPEDLAAIADDLAKGTLVEVEEVPQFAAKRKAAVEPDDGGDDDTEPAAETKAPAPEKPKPKRPDRPARQPKKSR